MNTGNIKQFIGVAAISLLTACGSPTPDAVLLKPGVSRELAQFRKEHFKEVRYNLFYNPQNQKSRFQKRKIKKNGKRFVDSLYSLIDLKTI